MVLVLVAADAPFEQLGASTTGRKIQSLSANTWASSCVGIWTVGSSAAESFVKLCDNAIDWPKKFVAITDILCSPEEKFSAFKVMKLFPKADWLDR